MLINYQISIHISKSYISFEFCLPFHRYIYTNIKMLPLKWHQASTANTGVCTLYCTFLGKWVISITGPLWGKLPVDSSHEGPVMWDIGAPFDVSLNKLLNKQFMGRWFGMYWSLFDVAVMINNKIYQWIQVMKYIWIRDWQRTFPGYTKTEINIGNNYVFLTWIPLPL